MGALVDAFGFHQLIVAGAGLYEILRRCVYGGSVLAVVLVVFVLQRASLTGRDGKVRAAHAVDKAAGVRGACSGSCYREFRSAELYAVAVGKHEVLCRVVVFFGVHLQSGNSGDDGCSDADAYSVAVEQVECLLVLVEVNIRADRREEGRQRYSSHGFLCFALVVCYLLRNNDVGFVQEVGCYLLLGELFKSHVVVPPLLERDVAISLAALVR